MKVGDVMSRRVITVGPEEKLRELWKIIFKARINAVTVTDKQKKLLGIISREDVLKLLYPDYEDLIEDFFSITDFEEMEKRIDALGSKKSKDIMSKRVVFTRENTPIMRALSRMIVRRLNQLPVLDSDDRVVGMLTKGDVFYALFRSRLGPKVMLLKKQILRKH